MLPTAERIQSQGSKEKPMNLIKRLQAGLNGPGYPAPATAPPPPAQADGLPSYCPECGSGNAFEVTERDRRSTRLTCPDCGLGRRTELLR